MGHFAAGGCESAREQLPPELIGCHCGYCAGCCCWVAGRWGSDAERGC